MTSALPIDDVLADIVHALKSSSNLVLEAPPGAGKTTRVPPVLLPIAKGEILVLEPRRIAARMAARRVSEELGERPGQTVGFQVRFEEVAGPATQLRFITEGVFTRRLLSDGQLRGVSIVILDEFHERRLDADLALALLRRLQLTTRPDLKLVVMSATLNAQPIATYLGDCPIIRSEGRLFPVEISYTPHSSKPLEEQVATAFGQAPIEGDALVFLPGAAEIRRTMRACESLVRTQGVLVLPLHGDLPPEEQDRAVLPADRRKLILSTNVAESSITIDGVTTVIDSGLARVASDSPWTGLPTLQVQRISKASATQRSGRAGRTRPGRAIRLYPFEDFQRRPEHDSPEILRRELSQTLLELHALGIDHLPWFEKPLDTTLAAAKELLDRLRAVEDAMRLASLPAHPRLARMILDGDRRGAGREAIRLAALLSAGDRVDEMNVLDAIDKKQSWRVEQIERQLLRLVRPSPSTNPEQGLELAVLAAFPDRVGKLRTKGDVHLSNGKAARLGGEWPGELLVAVEIEDRKEAGPPLIRTASQITSEALVELFPDRLRERQELVWNREGERVEAIRALLYDEIAIEETRTQPEPEAAATMLFERARDVGLHRFQDIEALELLLARTEFASRYSDLPRLTYEDAVALLEQLCSGLRSFGELERASRSGLIPLLEERAGGARALNEVAPKRLPLKNRQVKVHYVPGQQPWIESRLQDFFGLHETPRIARGRAAVLAHLLAPNHRPVQVTSDLEGFWQRLYPQVRKELSRRYPRHSWPEKPD